MNLMQDIAAAIGQTTGEPFSLVTTRPMGGGCINSTYLMEGPDQSYFVKLNDAHHEDMFEAEADGLCEIVDSHTVRAPAPVCHGHAGGSCFLVLEYLELGDKSKGETLGEQLAAMHKHVAEQFGWHRNNTIGSTPQSNTPETDWVRFYSQHRLRFQMELAAKKGAGRRLMDRGERLLEGLHSFFTDYRPKPSLLHGDLWGGNWATTLTGEPVIFDPAVYYGDREADIAMTELFSGFGGDFYSGYNATWPLDPGYETRKTLYNLYHIINHFNLFGGGYLSQAEHMIDRLNSELA